MTTKGNIMDEVGAFKLSTSNGGKVWVGEKVWSGMKENTQEAKSVSRPKFK
jgi:hypothetical protein